MSKTKNEVATTTNTTVNPFEIAKKTNEFGFIKPVSFGANEYRYNAGEGKLVRNGIDLSQNSLKMHVFYISPVLNTDTFFIFNETQADRTRWIEIGFFDENGKFSTICAYDFAINSLYHAIREMPEGVIISKDKNGGVYLFATLQWTGEKKEKSIIGEDGKPKTAKYYVPRFEHLPNDFPEALMADYKKLFYEEQYAGLVDSLKAMYRLPNATRYDRKTGEMIVAGEVQDHEEFEEASAEVS